MAKGTGFDPEHGGRIITVEKTSKTLKLQQMLSTLLLIVGVVMMVAYWPGENVRDSHPQGLLAGALATVIGLLWYFWVRVLIWWRHG